MAGRRRRVQRLSGRGGRATRCCSTAAAACSASCARVATTCDVDAVVISHLHADHILDLVPYASALTYAPRQQPVPVAGHPGTDSPAPAAADRAARAPPRRCAGCAAAPACARSTSSARSRSASTPRRTRSSWGRSRARFRPVPHFLPTNAVELADGDGAAHLQRRPRAERRAVRVRARHRPAADRGHAAAPRARGPARAPDPRRGGRARPPGGRAAARAHPLLRRAGRRLGAGARPSRPSARRSSSPARARSTTSTRRSRTAACR